MRSMTDINHELSAVRFQYDRYQRTFNEGADGFNPFAHDLHRLQTERDQVEEAAFNAAVQAHTEAENAEWTRNVTLERRAAWNTWVKGQGKTISPAQAAAHQKAIGYDMITLKRQIDRHRL